MNFDLKDFVDNPRLDKIGLCRKDDLPSIATHFEIAIVIKKAE